MTETHPLPFSPPMVRALREGRKTQTRRVLKGAMEGYHLDRVGTTGWQWTGPHGLPRIPFTPPYAPGDLIWVREAWRASAHFDDLPPSQIPPGEIVQYLADGDLAGPQLNGRYRHGRFMCRWMSRLTLRVDYVRVMRLQDITDDDAAAEGCPGCLGPNPDFPDEWDPAPAEEFEDLWNGINGGRPGCAWSDNPWVVVLTFGSIRANVDDYRERRSG